MEEKDLIELRNIKLKEFDSPTGLLELIDKVITDPKNIPLVVGYQPYNINMIQPAASSDEITLLNFITGLKRLESYYKEHTNKFKNFNGQFFYHGINSLHYGEQDSQIIGINVHNGPETSAYSIKLFYCDEKKYGSEAKEKQSSFDVIMKPHIGPKNFYRRRLL